MEQNQLMTETEDMAALADSKGTTDTPSGRILSFVEERFRRAKNARQTQERIWLQSYRNYRGVYSPEMQFTSTEKSRVFVKITKTKVLAAFGQIVDVLFGSNKFPITIDPTTLPDGVEDTVHIETDPQVQQMEKSLLPGETLVDMKKRLGAAAKMLEPVKDKVKPGPGLTSTQVTFHPAMLSAKKMEKKIHDQLEESQGKKHLRASAFELALFGSGVVKGPFAVDKEYPNWDEQGNYNPLLKTVPMISHVSIWNFYPDPDAVTMEESDYVVERHKMSRTQLRALKRRPFFRDNEIEQAILGGESYIKEWWEHQMEETNQQTQTERYEVLEFWGMIDAKIAEQYGLDIPRKLRDIEEISVNIWVCNGRVLRLVMNPFTPSIIPYYVVPYEINPYSMFGVGVGENMDDTQTLMNGFMRMAVDNAALSGNMLIEIDETNLVPGQTMDVYPGKIFRRQGGAPGQAIFGTKFPNVSNENMQMFDKARVLADESTGFPSFAHGQTGVSGVGRTASGISMLMSAANGAIRTVVQNVDDYLLAPLGKAMFSFNMQFDFDPEIKGDLEVKAAGTQSLMANEVRSQRLMQFLSVVQSPVLAPFAKMDYLVREIALSMDLDPDKVANSLQAAAVQAEVLKTFQATQPQPQPQQQMGLEGPPPATAGQPGELPGNIGIGGAPAPNEQGFTGNTGGVAA